ncbi:FAD-dependent oxidoreductase [Ensifer canadensis]
MNREEIFDGLRQSPKVDVCVLGGGINGLSVFRELALQGVNVVLVEKHDFCSGASAALSRMVHGGLRYLENGEFSLVRESLVERDRLLRNAPHYVASATDDGSRVRRVLRHRQRRGPVPWLEPAAEPPWRRRHQGGACDLRFPDAQARHDAPPRVSRSARDAWPMAGAQSRDQEFRDLL